MPQGWIWIWNCTCYSVGNKPTSNYTDNYTQTIAIAYNHISKYNNDNTKIMYIYMDFHHQIIMWSFSAWRYSLWPWTLERCWGSPGSWDMSSLSYWALWAMASGWVRWVVPTVFARLGRNFFATDNWKNFQPLDEEKRRRRISRIRMRMS